jgi:hypothetical protein
MEPNEIWQTIVKADEAIKYATKEKAQARRAQAEALLRRALAEAKAAGNTGLEDQARTRLRDLGVDVDVGDA